MTPGRRQAPVVANPVGAATTGESLLLSVEDLWVRLHSPLGSFNVAEDVSWSVRPGQTVALVGESGCGKTVGTLSLARLLPAGVEIETSGRALFRGRDLLAMSERELQGVRGREIGFVFQDPLTAFNPSRTVGRQISEAIVAGLRLSHDEARKRTYELFDEVGISESRMRYSLYPHEFSGGMRQRVMVAMAIAGEPSLLIADEPTTALDVTIQAQVLQLLKDIQAHRGMGIVLITHDIGVVAAMADTVTVVYGGRVIEQGALADILSRPHHPYTIGLLDAIPRAGAHIGDRFDAVPGVPPDLAKPPAGCVFAPRCAHRRLVCERRPALLPVPGRGPDHRSACVVPEPDRRLEREASHG